VTAAKQWYRSSSAVEGSGLLGNVTVREINEVEEFGTIPLKLIVRLFSEHFLKLPPSTYGSLGEIRYYM
jgi:hypothetical protein